MFFVCHRPSRIFRKKPLKFPGPNRCKRSNDETPKEPKSIETFTSRSDTGSICLLCCKVKVELFQKVAVGFETKMYVSDSTIFPSSGVKVRVTNMEGQDCLLEIKPDQKIDELKIMALNNFINPSESMKSSLYHKVLLVRTSKILGEERTVTQEGLKNNGKLWPIEFADSACHDVGPWGCAP